LKRQFCCCCWCFVLLPVLLPSLLLLLLCGRKGQVEAAENVGDFSLEVFGEDEVGDAEELVVTLLFGWAREGGREGGREG